MNLISDKLIFSTGKEVYCNRGIVGLCHDLPEYTGAPEWSITYGYDGSIWREGDRNLTKEEVCELADHMISQWQKMKDTITKL